MRAASSFCQTLKVVEKPNLLLYRKKISDRLKDYIQTAGIESQARIFPIGYTAAWSIVIKAGKLVCIHLRPHDLRRHAATYASRSGTPIEIISKVVLRHSNLSTTQIYLGKSATPRRCDGLRICTANMKKQGEPLKRIALSQ